MAMAALLTVTSLVPASSLDLDQLLERIAPADGTIERDYTQTRESSLLTESITTRGRIHYESPGYLRKTGTDEDGRHEVVVDGDTVHVERDGEETSFPLGRSPELEALMLLLDAVARADGELLRERFRVELVGEIDKWEMQLESLTPVENESRGVPQNRKSIRLDILGGSNGVHRIMLDSSSSGSMTLEMHGDGG